MSGVAHGVAVGDGLQQLYQTEIQPLLDELEATRLRARNHSLIVGAIVAPITLLVIAGALLVQIEFLAIFALVAAVLAWAFFTNAARARYCDQFKQNVVARLVHHLNPQLSYVPDAGIEQHEFSASRIYTQGIDRYACEDLITGSFGATAFRLSEVDAEYKTTSTDSKGNTNTSWHTIFQGLFFIGDFNKRFGGMTFVLPDQHEGLLGGVGRTLQAWGGKLDSRPGELVALEDPEFERAFVVYATDQVEARYLLSTSLMRRLLEFRARVKRPLALAFIDSNLYLAISTSKQYFEPPSVFFGSATMTLDDIKAYLADVALARDLIEDLNLNLRIWSKA